MTHKENECKEEKGIKIINEFDQAKKEYKLNSTRDVWMDENSLSARMIIIFV